MTAMRERLIRWLRALLRWLDPPVPTDDAVLALIRALVQQHAALTKVSGDRKRRLVRAAVRQQFPDLDGRLVGLAIERAVQELD